MKSTYVIDARRRVVARHKGSHDLLWGEELRRHYDAAIAAAEFPTNEAPCSVVEVEFDPFANRSGVIGEVLPS